MSSPPDDDGAVKTDEKAPRGPLHLAVLALATVALVALCYLLTAPFLPALAWALALAVIAYPLHRWLTRRLLGKYENLAAGLSVTLVIAFILVPCWLVAARLATEARAVGEAVEEQVQTGGWRETLGQVPYLAEVIPWLERHVDLEGQVRQALQSQMAGVNDLLAGSVWALLQLLLMVFVLFYFFRDRDRLLAGLRALSPLTRPEQERLAVRVEDSIYATIYGMVVIGVLQGGTGGLLFWLLGVPSPVLWGVIMFVLTVLPFVGAVLVWVPVTGWLLLEGRVGPALAVLAWGVAMSGPISNFVYARCAGDRMSLHPVPTLIAYLGGLVLFGVSGMVLGPLILALTVGVIEVWQGRIVPAGSSPTTILSSSSGATAAEKMNTATPATAGRSSSG